MNSQQDQNSKQISLENVLNEDGNYFMQAIKESAEACYSTASTLSKRNEIPLSVIEENTQKVPGILRESLKYKDGLRKVDDSIRRQKRNSRVLKDLTKIIHEVETHEKKGNKPRVRELARRKREMLAHAKKEIMLMSDDVKESLRLRFMMLRAWRQMISLDVNLNSAYVYNLVTELNHIAENTNDEELKELISNRIQEIPEMEQFEGQISSPPDDPEELRELIYQELRELVKIEEYRDELSNQTMSMQNIENFLIEEVSRKGFPSITPKSFHEEDYIPMGKILADLDFIKVTKQYASEKTAKTDHPKSQRMAYHRKKY